MFETLKRFFFHSWYPGDAKHYWKAYRFFGGGAITSPYPMDEGEAVDWVSGTVKGEIAYIDRELGFIFYRPRE
jgi:hypothetical protein